MGIDKPNVRFVMHYILPRSLEEYYQECGRAGRDGENSECILFFAYEDLTSILKRIHCNKDKPLPDNVKKCQVQNLQVMASYGSNLQDCRRKLLLAHFDENSTADRCCIDSSTICSNCYSYYKESQTTLDITSNCRKILEAIGHWQKKNQQFTLVQAVELLMGRKTKKKGTKI